MSKLENPPAFPSEGEGHGNPLYHSPGMTLRDYFAAAALRSYVALEPSKHALNSTMAYAQADAMLEARAREDKNHV